jgi:hypothetical protein
VQLVLVQLVLVLLLQLMLQLVVLVVLLGLKVRWAMSVHLCGSRMMVPAAGSQPASNQAA